MHTEAKELLFELNAFYLNAPSDLARLRKKAGPFASRITALSFRVPAVLNMNALLELRAFTSLTSIALVNWSDHFYCDFTKERLEMKMMSDIDLFHTGVLSILLLLPHIRFEFLASDAMQGEVSTHEFCLEYADLLTGWGDRNL